MGWLQVETKLGVSQTAEVEAVLTELGAVSITLKDAGNQPLLEPKPGETPLWSSTIVTAMFPEDTESESISNALGNLIDASQLSYSIVSDADWQQNWRQELEARRFGDRLWVLPNGDTSAPEGSVIVHLDPGLAFGTGAHPTTSMCLEWLESTISPGDRVLDYGCGSGLLGIAAAKLGATSVCATDIDPQALDSTRNNAKNNACSDLLRAVAPELLDNSEHYDVLVANILSGILIELGPRIEALVAPGARLAITGILTEQAPEVASAWSGWADMQVSKERENWVLLTGSKH